MKRLLIILVLLLTFSSCASNKEESSQTQTVKLDEGSTNEETLAESEAKEEVFTGKYMISAKDAIAKIGDPNVIFIDARGAKGAEAGHLEGAVVMAWGEISNTAISPGEENWGHLLPPEELGKKLGELGIDPSKEIILYSTANQGWGEDGRILWTLEASGYENLKMVDGGIFELKQLGADLVKGPTSAQPLDVKIDSIDRSTIIDTEELKKDYDKYKILDTREKEEYDGAVLYGEAKGGHLPGAINIPYTSLFKNNGTLKPNAEIEKIFKDAGFNPEDNIVAYCTGGIRSAYTQLVLNMIGYENVKNYEGSYYNWAAKYDVE